MKKEFKATNVTCRFSDNLINKEDTTKATNLVTWKIRFEEYQKLANDTDYKDCLQMLSEKYPTKSIDELTDPQIKAVVTDDFELFKAHRKLVADTLESVNAIPVSASDFDALTGTDKTMILVEVHRNLKTVTVEFSGDAKQAIMTYYSKGQMKEVKNLFRSAFQKSVGTHGNLFCGFKLKKSDFSDADIRHAMALFEKGASRKTVTIKKEKHLSKYDWTLATDKKAVSKVMSDLFGVILESRSDELEKVLPATAEAEQPKE